MKNYRPEMSFDVVTAEKYRNIERGDEEEAVDFLEQRADGGPVLELAIGAGRIALPLAARGLRVDGVEISAAMVDQLQAKPGGDKLLVTIGDFADVPVTENYRLIFVVWNTFFNLLTQDDQVRCFANVAAHLTKGGCFVIETLVPSRFHRLRNHQHVDAEDIQINEVRFDALRHDASTQTIEESHIHISSAGICLNPIVQRYAWPSEMDLMARMAGMHLKNRWGGWSGEPFNSNSELHVSVYEK